MSGSVGGADESLGLIDERLFGKTVAYISALHIFKIRYIKIPFKKCTTVKTTMNVLGFNETWIWF